MHKPCAILLSAPGLGGEKSKRMMEVGPLIETGKVARQGAFGALKNVPSPTMAHDLWTIATGTSPYTDVMTQVDLGILMKEGTNVPLGERDISRNMPLWEVCAGQGVKSCCIAWPGLRMSRSDHLLTVTDAIHIPLGSSHRMWPLLPNSVNQHEYQETIARLRVHPTDIPEHDVDYLLNKSNDLFMRGIMRNALAAAATVQAITLDIMAKGAFRLILLHLDILDHLRRLQIGGQPMSPVVVARVYQFFDLLVGNLRGLLSRNATLIIVSPSARAAGGDITPGLLVLFGTGIGEHILSEHRLEDVAPTVLWLLDCVAPKSCRGRPLVEAWQKYPGVRPTTENSTSAALWS